jgi:hypothetical protein
MVAKIKDFMHPVDFEGYGYDDVEFSDEDSEEEKVTVAGET